MKWSFCLQLVLVAVFIDPLKVLPFSPANIPDTLNVLAIRVEFQEDDNPNTTGNGKFDLTSPTPAYQVDPPPHNRSYFEDHLLFLRNYFQKISGNRLYIRGEVFPAAEEGAYQLSAPMGSYNPNTTPEAINNGLARLFRDALLVADEDPAIDFSKYQSVVIFHAGVGKDVDLGFDETPQDIPSLFITQKFLESHLGQSGISVDNGFKIFEGMLLPETESQDGLELGLNGMLASNFGSQLGWLDLFSPETGRSGIGRFGLMDAGLFNGDGLLPAIPCAWTRILAGWEQPITIYQSPGDLLSIFPPLSDDPRRVYRIPISEREYFLVEARYAGKVNFDSVRFEMGQGRSDYPTVREVLETHFADQVEFSPRGVLINLKNPDIGLPGTGCLIWHIDENVIEANRTANRINADPYHRGVDLEEADGSQDIGEEFDFLSAGSGSEIGWVLDMWYEGNSAPLFKRNKNSFSANTTPNSRSYYHRANSHITLSEFSKPDSIMHFRVKLKFFQQNFPRAISRTRYGKITSLKTSDVDFDDKGEIVATTHTGKILVLNHTAQSSWGSDSLEVTDVGEDLLPLPVLFTYSPSPGLHEKRIIALTTSGKVHGFVFKGSSTFESLFPPMQIPDSITTHPVAVPLDEHNTDVYWGTRSGRIYKMMVHGSELPFDTLSYSLGETVTHLHLNSEGRIFAVTSSGTVFFDDSLRGEIPPTGFRPVGNVSVSVTPSGEFYFLEEPQPVFAEKGIHRFNSPLVAFAQHEEGLQKPLYFIAGDNHLYGFNANFTLLDNFPVKIYDPWQETDLYLSPLIGRFRTQDDGEDYGVLVADPFGVIDGFDLKGHRLADFPLSTGDSLRASPLLLDIDGDGDVELAAATVRGQLIVWDLPSAYNRFTWNQLYFDEMNSNRNTTWVDRPSEVRPPVFTTTRLLPEDKAYNWPNPNIENYTFIRYYLSEPASVEVKIFDLAGDLVKTIRAPGEGQTDNEVRWDLTDVQSGVYLGRIEATSGNRKEVRIIKIAVVK
ncbi:MAG: hypothetical protein Kow0042_18580 [Calditrichia bacterium]